MGFWFDNDLRCGLLRFHSNLIYNYNPNKLFSISLRRLNQLSASIQQFKLL